jgi:hypothetical protein
VNVHRRREPVQVRDLQGEQRGPAVDNTRVDRWTRVELRHAVVDIIAPAEYLVRPSQLLVYVFLLDVGFAAVQSGMVATPSSTHTQRRRPHEDRNRCAAYCAASRQPRRVPRGH